MTTDNTDPREPNEANTDLINPGDREAPPTTSAAEKGNKTAVAYEDALGNPIEVPTYFTVEGENAKGEQTEEALHHVKDAEKISDVIREARVDESGDRKW